MIEPYILKYDQEKFPMVYMVADILDISASDLTELRDDTKPVVDREHDQETEWHQKFYGEFEWSTWRLVYNLFARIIGLEVLGTSDFYFQRIPTFRVSLPGNLAVGEFHRDTEYNHQAEEVNVWIPVTPAYASNTIMIENKLWYASPGDALIFSGAMLHGNLINQTKASRVSFDFRVIRKEDLRIDGRETLHSKMAFAPGEYWDD